MTHRLLILISVACVTLTTLFIRVPLPTGGYFNFGDIGVVFGSLLVGSSLKRRHGLAGFVVGGVGSAIADVLGGYAMFAPITFVAKGLEGLAAALASQASKWTGYVLLACGGSAMVGVYFLGEWLMPSTGLQGAIAEIVPNITQAVGGAFGGRILYGVFSSMVGDKLDLNNTP